MGSKDGRARRESALSSSSEARTKLSRFERVPLARAGVAVDFYSAHGTWFDRAELGRVLETVRARQQAELDSYSPYQSQQAGAPRPVSKQLAHAASGIVGLVSHILTPG